jgi:hypothetical protein
MIIVVRVAAIICEQVAREIGRAEGNSAPGG